MGSRMDRQSVTWRRQNFQEAGHRRPMRSMHLHSATPDPRPELTEWVLQEP